MREKSQSSIPTYLRLINLKLLLIGFDNSFLSFQVGVWGRHGKGFFHLRVDFA
jgi:hypothetical protein